MASALNPMAIGLQALPLVCMVALALPGQAVGNTAPLAVPGGPYVVAPGSVTFDGSGSTDQDLPQGDAIVGYSWGFLSSANVVASGSTAQVSTYLLYELAAQAAGVSPIANPFTGLPTWPVFLTVADSGGLTHTALTSLRFMDGNYLLPSIPEPGSWALMGTGLGVLTWAARRQLAGQCSGRA